MVIENSNINFSHATFGNISIVKFIKYANLYFAIEKHVPKDILYPHQYSVSYSPYISKQFRPLEVFPIWLLG